MNGVKFAFKNAIKICALALAAAIIGVTSYKILSFIPILNDTKIADWSLARYFGSAVTAVCWLWILPKIAKGQKNKKKLGT